MKKGRMKAIASMLVLAITFGYFGYLQTAIASEVENQNSKTNQANVEFDAYLMKNGEKTYSDTKTIGSENYLYAALTVKNAGYLKDAKFEVENANFEFDTSFSSKEVSKVENNKISYNLIKNGSAVTIAVPFQGTFAQKIDLTQFNKQNVVKFTGTYVDGNGNEKQVKKEITIGLAWTAEKHAELSAQILKFIQFNSESKKSIVLQTYLQSHLQNNTLPIKESNIEVTLPTIENQKPDEVQVYATKTVATNGDQTGEKFTKENYTYNKETGKLTITVKNEPEENKVVWEKSGVDEFIISCIYEGKKITGNIMPIEIKVNSNLKIYEASQTEATKEVEGQIKLKNEVGSIIDFEIKNQNDSISKGQMYANYETTDKKETDYTQKIVANASILKVGETQVVDKLQMQVNKDNFVAQDGSKVETQGIIKEIKIAKTNFEKILGSEGTIKIYNEATLIGTINKNANVDENGNYIVNIAGSKLGSIKIETSTPKTEGKLEIEVTKQIGEITYSKAQAKNFTKIETSVEAQGLKGEATVSQGSIAKEITLIEPTSKAQIEMEPSQLSTIVTNENVKITGILETNTLECNLYKNPTLKIKLPKEIEEINIKNVEVLFETEGSKLTLKNSKVEEEQGSKIIKIELEGMQTNYNLGAVSKGVNVVITADLTVNKLTANKQEKIEMEYTNESTAETNKVENSINFVAPTGVVTTSTISNYKENAEKITAISGEGKTVTVETMSAARNVKYEMTVINNYNNTIDGISILGRIASKENTELGSNIEMPLTSGITVNSKDNSKVEIYYTENANADKDLSKQANGWTKTPADLSKVKSYLIVLKDYQMNTAEAIDFTYEAQLPANLDYNQTANENYTVYFNNNLEAGTIQDKTVSATIGIITGKGVILKASLESNKPEAEEIITGKIIEYALTVENTGTEVAENVIATTTVPTGLNYIVEDESTNTGYKTTATEGKEINLNIGNIPEGGKVEKKILMKVTTIIEDKQNVEIKFTVKTDSVPKQTETNTVKNIIAKTYYIVTPTVLKDRETLKEGESFSYYMEVMSSSTQEEREETVLEIQIPEGIEYESVKIEDQINKAKTDITNNVIYSYNKNTRKLTIELGTVSGRNKKLINLSVKTSNLEQNEYDKTVKLNVSISGKNARKQEVETEEIQISKIGFKIIQTSNIPQNASITAYEDLKYIFTIQNLSSIDMYNVKLTDILPEELTLNSILLKRANGETQSSYKNSINTSISGKETITLEVNVAAKPLDESKKVSNKLTLEAEEIGKIESNTYTHLIEKFDYSNIDDGGENGQTKRIMGQVWKDENKDGIKDENESKLGDVEVLLFNNQTGDLAKDEENNILKTVTSGEGNYSFTKIPKGKYTVIFLYNTANYSATAYQKQGVDESLNSDGIDTKITLNGVTRLAAITEEINVAENNIYNIDLGLVENPKFDLKLDKTVTKITVQTGNETSVYEYKDAKLAKKELVGKTIENTSIIVEYKIKVTNEGAIPGYVKKIVDYMPSEMKFNSELNSTWYTNGDGNLYNSSLANTLINPGESKEVTLLLTKKMTQNNLGVYNNTAEIYEAYNEKGIEDIDSVTGNKVSSEDDISYADVLITVKTGEAIIITAIIVATIVLAGVCIGAYIVNKRVIK